MCMYVEDGEFYIMYKFYVMWLPSPQKKSSRIWAFVVGVYWMSVCTWVVLWKSGRHVIGLRMRELKGAHAHAHDAHISKSSNMCRPEQFTVLVRDIPEPKPIISINKARSSVLADDGLADDVDGAAAAIPKRYAQEVDAFFRKLHPDTYVRSQVVVDIKKVLFIGKWPNLSMENRVFPT